MVKIIESSFVGQLHNLVMQDLTRMANFPNYNRQQVYDNAKIRVEEYYSEQELGDPKVLSYSEFNESVENTLSYEPENYSELYEDLKNQDKINQRQLEILNDITEFFKDAQDPNEVAERLFSVANSLRAENQLSFNEKNLIYGATQIGINSNYYWYVANNNPDSPWEDVPSKPPWWVRGLRDLGGFVVGYCVGSLISGGNPIVGAACGTVTGGGCSAVDK